MNKLVLKLDRMASKARRHEYQIGDYWNACDEAAEEILRLERERDETQSEMYRLLVWAETLIRSLSGWPETHPNEVSDWKEAWRKVRDAGEQR